MFLLKIIESSQATIFTASLADSVENFLMGIGLPTSWIVYGKLLVYLILAIVIVTLLQFIVRAILSFIIRKAHSTTGKNILDYAVDNKLPHYLALLAPYTFVRNFIPIMFAKFPGWIAPLIKAADIYLVLLIIWSMLAIIKSFINVLQERPAFAHKPMRSYIQVISIILYGLGGIVLFAIMTEQSPGVILAGLGAASAVTMLVFQDFIKGFVGSIQMTTNNMVELGDWVIVDKHKADGVVEEINLTTVKVKNFDNTITTVPTYSFISDSFQNFKPMQQSGGRRMFRNLYMKQGTIRFIREDELGKYKGIDYLSKVIEGMLEKYKNLDKRFTPNVLPITNNDLYMAYVDHYLKNHPNVNKEMTILFRQKSATSEGLPLELFAFTASTALVDFENITAEIVNHIIAMVDFFDLKLFEMLSDTAENP